MMMFMMYMIGNDLTIFTMLFLFNFLGTPIKGFANFSSSKLLYYIILYLNYILSFLKIFIIFIKYFIIILKYFIIILAYKPYENKGISLI